MSTLAIPQPEYRALMLFDTLPAGCISFMCRDESSLPHIRQGEWVVVDTTDRKPRHGELYVISFGARLDQRRICMVRRKRNVGWVDRQYGPDGWTVGAIRNDECRAALEPINARKKSGTLRHEEWSGLVFEANRLTGAWTEGPYQDGGTSYDHLCNCLVGCVIGLHAPQFEEPRRSGDAS